jgi:hypothetical protein
MDLSLETLQRLSQIRDPLGVLTVYVDARPEKEAQRNRRVGISVRRELQAMVADENRRNGSQKRLAALRARVAALEADDSLFELMGRGRGRVAIAPLSSGQIVRMDLQLSLDDGVFEGTSAYVAPLVAALDRGEAAGIVTVARDGLRIFDRRLGELTKVGEHRFSDLVDDAGNETGRPRTTSGFSGAAKSIPQDDEYRRSVDDDRLRWLHGRAPGIAREAQARAWRWLVLAGDARLCAAVDQAIPASPRCRRIVLDRNLSSQPAREIERIVAPALAEARRRRQLELVQHVRDAALAANGRGALGVRDVLAALRRGNVSHLLVDPTARHQGFVGPDGEVTAGDGKPGERPPWGLTTEPRLDERMIEQALGISAAITPVEGAAAEELGRIGDGVAAILRWSEAPDEEAAPSG